MSNRIFVDLNKIISIHSENRLPFDCVLVFISLISSMLRNITSSELQLQMIAALQTLGKQLGSKLKVERVLVPILGLVEDSSLQIQRSVVKYSALIVNITNLSLIQ